MCRPRRCPAERRQPAAAVGARRWLSAGRSVRSAARVSLARSSGRHAATAPATRGRGRPADEQSQRLVVRAFTFALAQRVRVKRTEHRPAARIDYRHHDLRPAGNVEHDAVELRTAGGDLDELSWEALVHQRSVLVMPVSSCGARRCARRGSVRTRCTRSPSPSRPTTAAPERLSHSRKAALELGPLLRMESTGLECGPTPATERRRRRTSDERLLVVARRVGSTRPVPSSHYVLDPFAIEPRLFVDHA